MTVCHLLGAMREIPDTWTALIPHHASFWPVVRHAGRRYLLAERGSHVSLLRVGTWGRVLTRGPSFAHLTCLNLRVRVHQLFFCTQDRSAPACAGWPPPHQQFWGVRPRGAGVAGHAPPQPCRRAGLAGMPSSSRRAWPQHRRGAARLLSRGVRLLLRSRSRAGYRQKEHSSRPLRCLAPLRSYRAVLAATLYNTLHRREAVAIGQTMPRVFWCHHHVGSAAAAALWPPAWLIGAFFSRVPELGLTMHHRRRGSTLRRRGVLGRVAPGCRHEACNMG